MGDRGLNKSRWATPSSGSAGYYTRVGDWNCSSCGFSNFQRRTDCMQCSTSRTGTPRNSSPARSAAQQNTIKPQWMNDNGFSNGYQAPTNDPASPISAVPSQDPAGPKLEGRLADSLWAPRNFKGRAKMADTSQVWIRKPSQDYAQSNMPANKTNLMPSPSTSPDLGLPYEVQHFILAMIQRILEEGCYDFAYRWIPGKLNERSWSCPEAVELSVWRDFLPMALPPNALVIVPQYSLDQGLKDAVRIRNAAVHRHLCDNFEIRKMAQQAQDLMTMFKDVTRQNKFHGLWEELNDWDRNSTGDLQAARGKLERALQEISERPMDDMDWTPNAVSLQEITSQVTSQVDQVQDIVEYGDEMEID